MAPSERALAWVAVAGHCCDAVGGLYLAYDVFKRHAGPLGVLTRAVTYSLVLAAPSWLLLGPAFGAIVGAGLGTLISLDHWSLARRQHARGSSPLAQPAWAGAARGLVLGLACMPRFGWRFGAAVAVLAGALAAAVYGAGLVPTYHVHHRASLLLPPRTVARAALLRGLAMGGGAALARLLVPTAGAGANLGLELAALVALASIAIAMITPVVEYWTENAGEGFFVYAGLSLLFCGLLCDTLPHVVELTRAAP